MVLALPLACQKSPEIPRYRVALGPWVGFGPLYLARDKLFGEFADAYPKALSGGMRQRLALARTMIVEPQLLLLDEPFGALDERTREDMRQLLLAVVRRTGCAVIFVTHDIAEAIVLADRVILLSRRPGRILSRHTVGSPKPRSAGFTRSDEFVQLHAELMGGFASE